METLSTGKDVRSELNVPAESYGLRRRRRQRSPSTARREKSRRRPRIPSWPATSLCRSHMTARIFEGEQRDRFH
jgi:hypothetical protein